MFLISAPHCSFSPLSCCFAQGVCLPPPLSSSSPGPLWRRELQVPSRSVRSPNRSTRTVMLLLDHYAGRWLEDLVGLGTF